MNKPTREKFATQMDAELLDSLRDLAKKEGRQLQSLVEEAIGSLLDQRRNGSVKPNVLKAYLSTEDRFASVYEKLAK